MTGSRLVVGIGNVVAAFIVVSIVAGLLVMQAPKPAGQDSDSRFVPTALDAAE